MQPGAGEDPMGPALLVPVFDRQKMKRLPSLRGGAAMAHLPFRFATTEAALALNARC